MAAHNIQLAENRQYVGGYSGFPLRAPPLNVTGKGLRRQGCGAGVSQQVKVSRGLRLHEKAGV